MKGLFKDIVDNLVIVEDDDLTLEEKEEAIKLFDNYLITANIPLKFKDSHKLIISKELTGDKDAEKEEDKLGLMRSHKHICLKGQLGTGKTSIAVAFLNVAFLKFKKKCRFVRCHKFLRADFDDIKSEMTLAENSDIIIIDDVHLTKKNDYLNGAVGSLILQRIEDNRKTIITTNMSLKDVFEETIYDKIDEAIQIIELKGENKRIKKELIEVVI